MLRNSWVSDGLVGSEEGLGSLELVKTGKILTPASLKVTIRYSAGRMASVQKNIRTGYAICLTAVKICTNTSDISIFFATEPANW
jgi:hypothetical protein